MISIRVSLLHDDSLQNAALIDAWQRDSADRLWVDIQSPTQEMLEPLLEERFGFHELAARKGWIGRSKTDVRRPQI